VNLRHLKFHSWWSLTWIYVISSSIPDDCWREFASSHILFLVTAGVNSRHFKFYYFWRLLTWIYVILNSILRHSNFHSWWLLTWVCVISYSIPGDRWREFTSFHIPFLLIADLNSRHFKFHSWWLCRSKFHFWWPLS